LKDYSLTLPYILDIEFSVNTSHSKGFVSLGEIIYSHSTLITSKFISLNLIYFYIIDLSVYSYIIILFYF